MIKSTGTLLDGPNFSVAGFTDCALKLIRTHMHKHFLCLHGVRISWTLTATHPHEQTQTHTYRSIRGEGNGRALCIQALSALSAL